MKYKVRKIIACICLLSFYQQMLGVFSVGPRILTRYRKWTTQELVIFTQYDRASSTKYHHATAYGITEDIGIQLNVPVIYDRLNDIQSVGVDDIGILGQWQFFKEPPHAGILNVGVKFPTRTTKEIRARGQGAFSFFADISGFHASKNWYVQSRTISMWSGKHKNVKTGFELFYSLSAGPKLNLKDSRFYIIVSLTGIFRQPNKIDDTLLLQTKGNVILFGPSFAWEKKDFIVGGSLELPIAQSAPGGQVRVLWSSAILAQIRF